MATITSEIVNEYFSEMNLRRAPFIMLDEFAIYPMYLSDKDSRHLLNSIFSNTMEPVAPKVDWTWWNTHYHRDWEAFLKSNFESLGIKID